MRDVCRRRGGSWAVDPVSITTAETDKVVLPQIYFTDLQNNPGLFVKFQNRCFEFGRPDPWSFTFGWEVA
ncbi:hypothetical protein J6590_017445 [Homalodisca vitripennis]|nr:hypothetical protein J6590_017445 [Homalodisca vitripennis]